MPPGGAVPDERAAAGAGADDRQAVVAHTEYSFSRSAIVHLFEIVFPAEILLRQPQFRDGHERREGFGHSTVVFSTGIRARSVQSWTWTSNS